MNTIIQNTLVFITVGFAVWFLVKKFFFKPVKANNKACGKNDCGCN